MDMYRVGLRLSSEDFTGIELPEIVPVFHRWIQRGVVEGPLVDVADYHHVHHGPGIVLVAFDANYAVNFCEGRFGLVWYRKRPSEVPLLDTLVAGARKAIRLCAELEGEPEFRERLRFGADKISVFSNDRLLAPNTASTEDKWRPILQGLARALWGASGVQLDRERNDPRERFSMALRSAGNPTLKDVLARLDGR